MAVLFSDPVDWLSQFQQALDTFRTSAWLGSSPSGTGAYPPLNVFRKGDDLVVVAEVPGIRKSDLQIQVKGNTIRIAGRKSVEYGENAGLHRRERLSDLVRQCRRELTLPVEVDADNVKAEYRDGILALYLPRAEHEKPRTISIG